MFLQIIQHLLNKNQVATNNRVLKNVKIAVPLKYLSNFWRPSEMPLINCKIYLEMDWTKNCIMSDIAGNTTLYVPIVILPTKDNVRLTKQLSEGFKRLVFGMSTRQK